MGGCVLDAHHDHRIAMSFNILSLISEKPILKNQSILTIFRFFKTLDRLGFIFI